MAKIQDTGHGGSGKPEVERKKDTFSALTFFLVAVILAVLAGAYYEHTSYTALKARDNTNSADDLNGQTPANTTGSVTGATTSSGGGAPMEGNTPAAASISAPAVSSGSGGQENPAAQTSGSSVAPAGTGSDSRGSGGASGSGNAQ